jgi:hypothetical protein
MSDFLLVLGDDREYPGHKAFCFIPKASIREIHPVWAVESDGKLWGCSRGFKDEKSGNRAKVHAFRLISFSDQEYSCSVERMRIFLDEDELILLMGEKPEIEERTIGFYVPEAAAPSPKRRSRKDPNDPNERAYLEAIARDRQEDLANTLRELEKECSNSSSTPTT